jgi:UDP-N-acetylmuramoylalanine--D-glutamate ligase
MIPLNLSKGKIIGVLGFGETGQSVVDAALAGGIGVVIYDDSVIQKETYKRLYADLAAESVFRKVVADGLCVIAVSPGINTIWPIPHKVIQFANKYGIPIINDVDLFQQNICKKKLICITGTNGKSTTTALINHVISQSGRNSVIGGNFGKPVLSLSNSHDFYVFELSSYQLESCNTLSFDTSVLLNITPDHLTRHGGIHGYISAKQKIFANFTSSSKAVISIDDKYCSEIYKFLKKINYPTVIPISGKKITSGVGWKDDMLIDNTSNQEYIVCKNSVLLDGSHNRQNIAAAYAACKLNGVNAEEFSKALPSFRGLEHRQEFVAEIDGVKYINDSKATNVQSVEQALIRYDNIFWILGGRPKEDGIELLKKYFCKIHHAFLIGEAAEKWYRLLQKNNVRSEISKTLDVAINSACKKAKTTDADVILLSPGCASFDQFKNFEERGDMFRSIVRSIV